MFESQLSHLILFSSLLSPSFAINGVVFLHSMKSKDGNSGFFYQNKQIMGHPPFKRRILMHKDCLFSLSAFTLRALCATEVLVCTQTLLGHEQSDFTDGKMVSVSGQTVTKPEPPYRITSPKPAQS